MTYLRGNENTWEEKINIAQSEIDADSDPNQRLPFFQQWSGNFLYIQFVTATINHSNYNLMRPVKHFTAKN